MKLRPYQQRDIERLRVAFTRHQRVLYRLPTGGGKTVTFASCIAMARGQVLVLCHRRELVAQAVATLARMGITASVSCASMGRDAEPGARVLVATVPTLARRGLPAGFRPSLVVADEAHLAASRTWLHVLTEPCADAYVLGVTATPERLDGRALGDIYGAMVEGPSIAELTDAGHLVPAVTYSVAPPGDDCDNKASAAAMARPQLVADALATYRELGEGRRALMFASNIEHAEALAQVFNSGGVPSEVLTGQTKDRDAMLGRFRRAETMALFNFGVLTEGFDDPGVSYVGLLRCTASLALYMQMVGRGLRPHPGKTDCIVADHGGNAQLRFGPVAMPRTWSLDGRRKRTRIDAEVALTVTTCGKCLALWSREQHKACPRCGAAPVPVVRSLPRQVADKLRRLEAAVYEQRQRERSRQTPAQPCPSWCDPGMWARLEERRIENGYKLGWSVGRARAVTRKWARGGRG